MFDLVQTVTYTVGHFNLNNASKVIRGLNILSVKYKYL